MLTVVGWLCWGVFVAEFLHRALRARDRRRFWARNWWQVLFLALPFLRFARALSLPLGRGRLLPRRPAPGGCSAAGVRDRRIEPSAIGNRRGMNTDLVLLAGGLLGLGVAALSERLRRLPVSEPLLA